MSAAYTLPALPAKHQDFASWIQKHPQSPVEDLVAPYNEYEAVVRKLFAQEPSNPILQDNHLNIVPVYGSDGTAEFRTRARDLATETPEQKEKYIMPLKAEDRRPNGSVAIVSTLEEFKNNFAIFSEASLSDMDWSNVIVAGSAVVTCLLPVPDEHKSSKRALRQFYHDRVAPASDVDLFLYGLSEEEAIEKIKHIEDRIKNAILHETTTIRTKNAVTIVSQYPTRHVQIVLRIYKSIAEVLTGFDVDCSCAAYDGKQVYASPRALAAYITQKNTIDLSRRSPSYENRLSKYSRRGFEVFWPQLDRSRIDPTIFERSFSRTVGLARLLVLEQLPLASDREGYLQQRRQERGRPAKLPSRSRHVLAGNIKDKWEDEVPEWLEEDEESNYNTFTIPYGRHYHARKIERLFYNQDLLLNAEWNKPKDREVVLHRHPAFFGNVEDIIHDCCGHCPTPVTEEEKAVAKKESKIYVSGDISFIKDDPGRQEIGSFNPITETDWTEMAYVGNTERLCQAIVDHDLETVKEWLSQESADPNTRDYTGRTPLHLACIASTPPVVQCLVDHGARLTSRVADGRTALHFAAGRGAVEIVKILLNRSELNEAEEDRKLQLRKGLSEKQHQSATSQSEDDNNSAGTDIPQDETTSYTLGSFVKVEKEPDHSDANQDVADDDNTDEPDVYDINVISWDSHTSPLHLAIINGHVDVVRELVSSWGADVLLPVKLLHEHNNTPRASILTLVLALRLPLDKAITMTETLLQLGASPVQADFGMYTPLHYIARTPYAELLDIFVQQSKPAAQKAINQLAVTNSWSPKGETPLTLAIRYRNVIGALKLLDNGADVVVEFADFINAAKVISDVIRRNNTEQNRRLFHGNFGQPIIRAVEDDLPELAIELLRRGADPNSLNRAGYRAESSKYERDIRTARSLLDLVRDKIRQLNDFKVPELPEAPEPREIDSHYFDGLEEGTYLMWHARHRLEKAQEVHQKDLQDYQKKVDDFKSKQKAVESKARAVADLRDEYKKLEATLLEKGAKSWKALFPELATPGDNTTVAATPAKANPKTPLKVAFTFLLPDLTDARKEGYLSLFEAAWSGDLATIKQLTLGPWGENQERPLQLAVRDVDHLSPISIAVFQGHYELIKPMTQIIQAQCKKEEQKGHVRYEMANESDCCSSESGDDESNPFPIYSTIVDNQFTIDDIGAVAAQVESDISPHQALHWDCPAHLFLDKSKRGTRKPTSLLEYSILADDIGLLRLLLQLGQHFTTLNAQDGESPIYDPGKTVFHTAIENGRLRCLEELIKASGPAFPLDALVRRSGADENEKPRYYQGLSVRGKKRTDWARHPNHFECSSPICPPLLYSAYCGNLQSTEWFLTTAPGRYYLEYTRKHAGNKQMQLLAKSKDGIEKPLMSWLNSGNHLVLHCAVLSKETEESRHLVEYLVANVPGCLEKKSEEGHTPLALAFSFHRVTCAGILIKAGANQTARDGLGHNLLHLLLCGFAQGAGQYGGNPSNVEALLRLLDQRLVPSLLTERAFGSLTPLARWLHEATPMSYYHSRPYTIRHSQNFNRNAENNYMVEVARCLLDFATVTNQKHLELLDGAGNSPVHDAVKRQLPRILKLMLDYRPDLLLRENATGATPLELAADAWLEEATMSPPSLQSGAPPSLVNRPLTASVEGEEQRSEREAIYDLCRSKAVHRPGKRKLVSLNEANEVAKRLAMKNEAQNAPNDATKLHSDADYHFRRWCTDARRV